MVCVIQVFCQAGARQRYVRTTGIVTEIRHGETA